MASAGDINGDGIADLLVSAPQSVNAPSTTYVVFRTPGKLRWQDNGTIRLTEGNVNNDTAADLTIFVKAAGPADAAWFVL